MEKDLNIDANRPPVTANRVSHVEMVGFRFESVIFISKNRGKKMSVAVLIEPNGTFNTKFIVYGGRLALQSTPNMWEALNKYNGLPDSVGSIDKEEEEKNE